MTRPQRSVSGPRSTFSSPARGGTTVLLVLAAVACRDVTHGSPPRPIPDANLTAALIVSRAVTASASGTGSSTIAYVSLPPGSIPDGTGVTIANRRTSVSATAAVVDGGFDPTPVWAAIGDTVDVTVSRAGGVVAYAFSAVVATRPPRVVRTNPPKGQTDVPVLRNMLVVFSEPVDPPTVTVTSLHLFSDTAAIAGKVVVNSFQAEFRPDNQLAGRTQYTLAIEKSITNLAGTSLESAVAVPFSTCPTYAIPTQCPPFSTDGNRLVSGVATELTAQGRTPLRGIPIYPWISKTDGNGFAMHAVTTDSTGTFRIPGVPDGEVLLQIGNDMDQPCAGTGSTVGQDIVINLDGVSRTMALPLLATAPSTITGMVFEMTADGKKPVAGARVSYEAIIDRLTAWTTTDSAGRYALCGLSSAWHGDLFASATGFKLTDLAVTVGTGLVMDLQLTR